MNPPIFLAIEASSPDDDAYPIAIAWSTPEGTIKSTLICPDDEWEPWYNISAEVDVQQLFDLGATSSEVMLELNNDISGNTVFFRDAQYDIEALLNKLSDSSANEPDFELSGWSDLFSPEQLLDYPLVEQELLHQIEGDPNSPEGIVKVLLLAHHCLNNKEL